MAQQYGQLEPIIHNHTVIKSPAKDDFNNEETLLSIINRSISITKWGNGNRL